MKKQPYRYSDIYVIVSSLLIMLISIFRYPGDGIHWSAAFFGLCFIVGIALPQIRAKQLQAELQNKEYVKFDAQGITRIVPHQVQEYILWQDISEIVIVTSDQGPFFDDVHWMLLHQDKTTGLTVSNDANGFSKLLEQFQSLPSFNNHQLIESMASTENAWFVVWTKGP